MYLYPQTARMYTQGGGYDDARARGPFLRHPMFLYEFSHQAGVTAMPVPFWDWSVTLVSFLTWWPHLRGSNLKEERFIWAHVLRAFKLQVLGGGSKWWPLAHFSAETGSREQGKLVHLLQFLLVCPIWNSSTLSGAFLIHDGFQLNLSGLTECLTGIPSGVSPMWLQVQSDWKQRWTITCTYGEKVS